MQIGVWDGVLLAAVSAQCTLIAYLPSPKWKALVLSLPIPFTTASLALGRPVDVTHVTGLLVFLGYMHAVRWLYLHWRLSIMAAILLAAAADAFVGAVLAHVLPRSPLAFCLGALATGGVALVAFVLMPRRAEPYHRTPLPLWRKLPLIAGVILTLILLKQVLSGYMTTFPMVGVVTAYEARHSLWTMCRQVPAFLAAFVPMQIAIFLAQDALGLGGALGVGWLVFFLILTPIAYVMWFAGRHSQVVSAATARLPE